MTESSAHYRRRIWHHNSLIGRAHFIRSAALAVMASETATFEAQTLAQEIEKRAVLLIENLAERNPAFEAERKEATND